MIMHRSGHLLARPRQVSIPAAHPASTVRQQPRLITMRVSGRSHVRVCLVPPRLLRQHLALRIIGMWTTIEDLRRRLPAHHRPCRQMTCSPARGSCPDKRACLYRLGSGGSMWVLRLPCWLLACQLLVSLESSMSVLSASAFHRRVSQCTSQKTLITYPRWRS